LESIDLIKQRLDIIDVASDYLKLTKAGSNHKALCPFHTEKTPSFIINPERQTWHCFGACGVGGDVIELVIKIEKINFSEALKILAQRAGVQLNNNSGPDKNSRLYEINFEACEFYKAQLELPEGKKAKEYIDKRGINDEASETFEFGFSSYTNSNLVSKLTSIGFKEIEIIQSGLAIKRENNQVRDFFYGRLMIPIKNSNGRVIGFGARVLDDTNPKYINTPSTPIFDKKSVLFGLSVASKGIRDDNSVVVVEGYLDVITAYQFGFKNVVASMGTALTANQVGSLKSRTNNFVLAMDSDSAGREAVLRSLRNTYRVFERQLGQKSEVNLSVVLMPSGKDPDTQIRNNLSEWKKNIASPVPFVQFVIDSIIEKYDINSSSGKGQVVGEIAPLITNMVNPFEQDHYIDLLAGKLTVKREIVESALAKSMTGSARKRQALKKNTNQNKDKSLYSEITPKENWIEDYTMSALLKMQDKSNSDMINSEYFRRTENREIYSLWQNLSETDELGDIISDQLEAHYRYLLSIQENIPDFGVNKEGLLQLSNRLEHRHLQHLQRDILSSSEDIPSREIEDSVIKLNERIKQIDDRKNSQ
jgi:DNA primase